MWVVRVHSGQLRGTTYPLNEGVNTLGRGNSCTVTIAQPNISKQHVEVIINNNSITIKDLGSSNGTFVDGLKVTSQPISQGQKFIVHDIVLDIVANIPAINNHYNPNHQTPMQSGQAYGNAAYNLDSAQGHQVQMDQNPEFEEKIVVQQGLSGFIELAKDYIENVILPGAYKIPENIDFKWTIGIFVGAFIIFVTSMSTIPLMRILKQSIEIESHQRALTIAKTEALINASAIKSGMQSTLTVAFANREQGVEKAYIIDSIDGSILAPSNEAGDYPDIDYIHQARKKGISEGSKQINDSSIVAIKGIQVYNPQTGNNTNKAYSVVIYNMGSLAVDDNKTISLFIQTLFIALLIGSFLFFLLYKVIIFPIKNINFQLDSALKDSTANITSRYQFPELQTLISNINSSLTRVGSENSSSDSSKNISHVDRSQEMNNLIQVIGFASIAIDANDRTIAALNPAFEEITNMNSSDLLYGSIDNILDQALKLSVEDLIQQVVTKPGQLLNNQLDINGDPYDISAQAIWGQSEVAYFIITLLPGGAE